MKTVKARWLLGPAPATATAPEANFAVLEHQQATFESIDPGEGLEVMDADTTRASSVDEIEYTLKSRS